MNYEELAAACQAVIRASQLGVVLCLVVSVATMLRDDRRVVARSLGAKLYWWTVLHHGFYFVLFVWRVIDREVVSHGTDQFMETAIDKESKTACLIFQCDAQRLESNLLTYATSLFFGTSAPTAEDTEAVGALIYSYEMCEGILHTFIVFSGVALGMSQSDSYSCAARLIHSLSLGLELVLMDIPYVAAFTYYWVEINNPHTAVIQTMMQKGSADPAQAFVDGANFGAVRAFNRRQLAYV